MSCPEGQYFCNDRQKCMPIPKGHKVRKDGELIKEVAPPTAKHERMVKHIKKGYSKDGKLTRREKAIAYATAWKNYKKNESIEESKKFKDFQLTLKTHDELNPKIWTDNKLDPEIATNLVKIGKEWAKFADIPEDVIEDYIIVGGNANFNYTKYSDIDLHLVVDKSKIGCEGCLDDFLRAKKQLWALTHNITIKGHPVELYAQDIDEKVGSKGQYSLNQKKWTQEPTPYKLNRKDPEVVKKVKDFIYQIDTLINAKSDDKDAFQKLKDKIGTMRKAAIQKSGEYAPENLVFKELRNRGYVEKVWNYLRDLGDKELSLEGRETTMWSAHVLLPSRKLKKVQFVSPSSLRQDAVQIAKAIFGATDVKQLKRVGKKKEVKEEVTLNVEIPSTPESFSAGLMFRESLDRDSGMLFVFDEVGEKSFHMRNTTIPLDIAFINEEGIIESIKELKPLDETYVYSEAEVLYALEVNRGWFEENDIFVGDSIIK